MGAGTSCGTSRVISCDVTGMEHVLPVLGQGRSLTLFLRPHPSLVGLGLGVFLGGE